MSEESKKEVGCTWSAGLLEYPGQGRIIIDDFVVSQLWKIATQLLNINENYYFIDFKNK